MEDHPLETYIALLRRYPDNPRYVAAAIADGFRFELPDVNSSSYAFSKGSDDRSIRVGFLRVDGIGPGAAGDLVRNQPFSSIEDIKERTSGRNVKEPTIRALREIGALECIGIQGEDDDNVQLRLLGMVLNKPRAFKGCRPQLKKPGANSSWEFIGLERGLNLTFGKRFCAKLFWVPDGAQLTLKSAVSGSYNSYLLPVVDENGIVYDLRCAEDKNWEYEMLKELAANPGAVVCAEGQVSLPFLRGGNTSFKFWGVVRAEDGNPQVWNVSEEAAMNIVRYARGKRDSRRSR
jgi:hypothetical protein